MGIFFIILLNFFQNTLKIKYYYNYFLIYILLIMLRYFLSHIQSYISNLTIQYLE